MRNTASTRPDLIDSPAAIATEERPRIVPSLPLEPGFRRPPRQGITSHPWVRSSLCRRIPRHAARRLQSHSQSFLLAYS